MCEEILFLLLLFYQDSFLMSVFLDAKIFPGPEERLALHVTRRQELAIQALPLPGWSPQRAPENLPSLEGRSQITCHFLIHIVKVKYCLYLVDGCVVE